MVEVHYRDRLGNNLFQYCLGRLIAEELGYALQAPPLEGFPQTAAPLEGARHSGPEQILGGQKIDFAAVLADRSPRKIILNGWFQRHEYYSPHRGRIQQWLAMDPIHETPCNDADIVVNVRRTDYIGLGWALPFSYYEEAIERLLPQGGRVVVVTDDPEDAFFLRFRRWKPRFFKGTPLQQMSYMSNAPRLVMSASTFSWWPAFLGDAEAVACPLPAIGIWAATAGDEGISLADRERFVCLECPLPYSPNAIEKIYQRMRSYKSRGAQWLNEICGLSLRVEKF